jgi:hypothetical protein
VISTRLSPALAGLAETLDVLITLTPPLAGSHARMGRARGVALAPDRVYRAARRRIRAPLADAAARALLRRVRPGNRVILTTGLVTPRIRRGETDGPPGAAALARALILGLEAEVLVLTEAPVVPVIQRTAEVLAASEGDEVDWRARFRVEAFPTDLPAAADAGDALWLRDRPAALVSIEKLGPNARGVIHTMRGEDVTAAQARVDCLFPLARRHGVLSIGIGDRGNEIGLEGLLAGHGRCACPCGGTIACAVRADVPVIAFSSNWGAHAVVAVLAARLGNSRLLHQPRSEARMLRQMVREGAMDGVTRARVPTVDGGPLALQTALVGMMHALLGSLPES